MCEMIIFKSNVNKETSARSKWKFTYQTKIIRINRFLVLVYLIASNYQKSTIINK